MNSAGRRRLAALGICIIGLLIVYWPVVGAGMDRIVTGADDFLSLYAGGRLIGTEALYNPDAVRRVQLEYAHVTGPSLLYTRLPWLAAVLHPLAQLPYRTAHWIWLALRLAAVAAFIALWNRPDRLTAAAVCCWSLPLAAGLANGQDGPFLMLWLAASLALEKSGRSFWAGAILALCTAKFHLFLLVPVLPLAHRKWKLLAGGAAGCGALAALSWAFAGWDWPARYISLLTLARVHPSAEIMPNLHGLAPSGWEWPLAAAVAAAAIYAIFRLDYLHGLAVALAGGLLISRHAYMQDAVILIPAILIVWSAAKAEAARYAALALASPLPWLALLRRSGGIE